MTDRELAEGLAETMSLERRAREYWAATAAANLPERDAALVVVRHTAALRQAFERWIAARHLRAELSVKT